MPNLRLTISAALTVGMILLVSALYCRLSPAQQNGDLALVGAKLYPSPQAEPIADAVVLVRVGRISAVRSRKQISIPKSVRLIDCRGKMITAGF